MCVCVCIHECMCELNEKFMRRLLRWQIAMLFPAKRLFHDESGFSHGFGAETSLPVNQSAPVLRDDATRFSLISHYIVRMLYPCRCISIHILLFMIYFIYFHPSDTESTRIVKDIEVEFVMKPRHLTSLENIFIQPFYNIFFPQMFIFSFLID